MANTFETLGLNPKLIDGLKKSSITTPTEIQSKVISLAIENNDIIGESMTGSGKTLAYLLPIFQRIDATKKDLQAIILAPTHELVQQIKNEIELLAKNSDIPVKSAAIIGEVNIKRQVEALKNKPHIVVGSTGRILELIGMKKLKPHNVKTIVIDECDRMLDENNISNVKAVIKTTLRDRQLMAFSASVNEASVKEARELMKSPKEIFVKTSLEATTIEHIYIESEQRKKFKILRKAIYASKMKKSIVFINKNELIQDITAQLKHHNFKVVSLFGNASKEDRKIALKSLRTGKANILVSSDLAARGLDVKGLTHVFNLDIPEDFKEYVHRAGRTGRAGKSGMVVSIATEIEVAQLKKISKKFNIKIEEKDLSEGKVVDKTSKKNYDSFKKRTDSKKPYKGQKTTGSKKSDSMKKTSDSKRPHNFKKTK
ncbi:DEAD/DEAH box helicase [Oceanirhabdus sp. W0125-5]|uniref:DEAD/DEAH box helicase n=1 Tax=Oceanirhabdus sp. W0125-5 TaxID=2999116 RepID=UPI0022F2B410|nr:DEAD/DEAH box helicase [Oceanirhabdus sp. W0125-5]WBW97062.1 DEAD/DEAH box helicase [Oceanirhabdus sp. W0125-5]